MSLPKFLSCSQIEDLMLTLGVSIDRQSVAAALRLVPLAGVIAPRRPGQRWVIPADQLLNLLVVLLARRSRRGVDFDRIFLDAAEYLMRDEELCRRMPPSIRRRVRERQKTRRRSPWWLGDAGRAAAG